MCVCVCVCVCEGERLKRLQLDEICQKESADGGVEQCAGVNDILGDLFNLPMAAASA